jgi:hypothetical protein
MVPVMPATPMLSPRRRSRSAPSKPVIPVYQNNGVDPSQTRGRPLAVLEPIPLRQRHSPTGGGVLIVNSKLATEQYPVTASTPDKLPPADTAPNAPLRKIPKLCLDGVHSDSKTPAALLPAPIGNHRQQQQEEDREIIQLDEFDIALQNSETNIDSSVDEFPSPRVPTRLQKMLSKTIKMQSGAMFPPSAENTKRRDAIAKLLRRHGYNTIGVLASGSFAEVYAVTHPSTGQWFAAKVSAVHGTYIPLSAELHPNNDARDDQVATRAHRRHPLRRHRAGAWRKRI